MEQRIKKISNKSKIILFHNTTKAEVDKLDMKCSNYATTLLIKEPGGGL